MTRWTFAPVFLVIAAPLSAEDAPAPQISRQQQQVNAVGRLDWMDGTWRGSVQMTMPNGSFSATQTERVGPLLDGTVRLVEGRRFSPDGNTSFNALAVIWYDPVTANYSISSKSGGPLETFPLTLGDDGYFWEARAGDLTIRYTTSHVAGRWIETGERIESGKAPEKFFEMALDRIGDTDWPAGQQVPPG